MPLYDYKCTDGHIFEEMQAFSDDPISECRICGADAKRLLSVPMVVYKGSGFYTTDYGRNSSTRRDGSSADGNGKASSSSKSEKSGSDSKEKASSSKSSSSE